jgi:hypothetical protein
MHYWLVPLLSVLVRSTIIIATAYHINRQSLREIAEKKAESNELALKIKKIFKEGNYNNVNIGLLDSNFCETREMKITSENITLDFKEDEIIYL